MVPGTAVVLGYKHLGMDDATISLLGPERICVRAQCYIVSEASHARSYCAIGSSENRVALGVAPLNSPNQDTAKVSSSQPVLLQDFTRSGEDTPSR